MADDILFERRGGVALITLNRPAALNALTLDMVHEMTPRLADWANDPAVQAVVIQGTGGRAFCAGGDVMAMYNAHQKGDARPLGRVFFRDEYRLNRAVHRFPKPYIALLDGIAMGGGVGVSVHGSHRVATEHTQFAMPETGIGLFPDVGASYVLSRCPGETGIYLGLVGARIKAADALYLGLCTHHVAAARQPALIEALAEADWSAAEPYGVVDAVLDGFNEAADAPPLAAHRAAIDRCFAGESIEATLAALEAEGGDFAAKALVELAKKSPTSLKMTLRELREGRRLDFDACMVMEYRLSQACIAGHDFFEGIRALLVDRDFAPRWDPPDLAGVTVAMVDDWFAPLGADDLTFDA